MSFTKLLILVTKWYFLEGDDILAGLYAIKDLFEGGDFLSLKLELGFWVKVRT